MSLHTPVIINDTSELYSFLNDAPTPIYGIVSAPLAINFDFNSKYIKVLAVDTNDIKLTGTTYY